MAVAEKIRQWSTALFARKPPGPDILKVARRFKADIVSRNDVALNEMRRIYWESWRRLAKQFDEISLLIRKAEEEGKYAVLREAGSGAALAENEYSADWLFRQQRYRELMRQCEVEMTRFGALSSELTATQQQLAMELGEQHAAALMKAGLGPMPPELARMGYTLTWNRVPTEALANLVGFLSDGSPLAYKFAELTPAVSQGIRDTIATGFAMGWSPRKMASEIKRTYGGGLTNALTVCRTETLRAYRTASMETYRANSDVCTGWIWTCARQAHTCSICWSLDGTFHTLDEDLNDHANGRCSPLPKTCSWNELAGRKLKGIKETSVQPWEPDEYFSKLSEKDQRKVLGNARFEAWRAGDLRLRDIPVKVKDKVWGDHYRPKTLQELGIIRNPLPNYGKAVIPDGKIKEYALDMSHERGKHKAVVFASALGYNQSNADDLINKIRNSLNKFPAHSRGEDEYGLRYNVLMDIKGPNKKTATVLTGWIIRHGEDFPRLTTTKVK